MKIKAVTGQKLFKPALGAGVAALCGLVLWTMPLGERWVNASYDYLFRFGARPVTNQVVVILTGIEAHDRFRQIRGEPRDRALRGELLNRLAGDGCPFVALDYFFDGPEAGEKPQQRQPGTAASDGCRRSDMRLTTRASLSSRHAGCAEPLMGRYGRLDFNLQPPSGAAAQRGDEI